MEDIADDVVPRQGTSYTTSSITFHKHISFPLHCGSSVQASELLWIRSLLQSLTLALKVRLSFVGPVFSMKFKNGYSVFILRRAFHIASLGAVNVLILTPNKQLSVNKTLNIINRQRKDVT